MLFLKKNLITMLQLLSFNRNTNFNKHTFRLLVQLVTLFISTNALILLPSCDKEKDLCGPEKEYNLLTANFPKDHYYSNNKAYFQYSSPLIENVCPHQHVKVQAFITLKTNSQPVLATKVYGSYSIFFAPNIPLDKTNDIAPGQKQYVHF